MRFTSIISARGHRPALRYCDTVGLDAPESRAGAAPIRADNGLEPDNRRHISAPSIVAGLARGLA
jgi:hypothetical protein